MGSNQESSNYWYVQWRGRNPGARIENDERQQARWWREANNNHPWENSKQEEQIGPNLISEDEEEETEHQIEQVQVRIS